VVVGFACYDIVETPLNFVEMPLNFGFYQ